VLTNKEERNNKKLTKEALSKVRKFSRHYKKLAKDV
jgi:hypothetical protein